MPGNVSTTVETHEKGERRLLIVDDNAIDRRSWMRFLRLSHKHDYVFLEAETGKEAAELFKASAVDCVLLDYRLPDMDGVEVLEEFAAASDRAELPVVMLTGQGNEAVAVEAMKRGAQDYIVKAEVNYESLDRAITNAIEKVSLQEMLRSAQERIEEHGREIGRLNMELRAELDERVTELARLHIESVRNERMVVLGQLAGGVAHELNNPIMGIINHIQYALAKLPPDQGVPRQALEAGLEYSRRCAEIIRDLLLHARRGTSVYMPEGVSATIASAVDLALRDANERIEEGGVRVELVGLVGVPDVALDESALRQVILNLVRNACDAMEDAPTRILRFTASHDGPEVTLRIGDSGCGIDEVVLDRVFDPFFTTKKVGSGSGLGLGLCKRIVENSNGRIEVDSTSSEGTEIAIVMPKAVGVQPSGAARPHAMHAAN